MLVVEAGALVGAMRLIGTINCPAPPAAGN